MAAEKRLKNLHPSEEVLSVERRVCVGRGVVMVPETAIECAFCKGTGVYPDKRLTCITCGGKGRAAVSEPFEICRKCNGLGASPNENLPCVDCGGTGVVKAVEF